MLVVRHQFFGEDSYLFRGQVLYRQSPWKMRLVGGYIDHERHVLHLQVQISFQFSTKSLVVILDRVSVQEAVFLLVRPLEELKSEDRADLAQLAQMSATIATLHHLVQAFGHMVRKRQGQLFSDWKQQVEASKLAEIQRFVKGLEKDKEAVLAGLTESYSNGMTEGFVNKLKLIKRMSYGRASFPLLRQRVLHAM